MSNAVTKITISFQHATNNASPGRRNESLVRARDRNEHTSVLVERAVPLYVASPRDVFARSRVGNRAPAE